MSFSSIVSMALTLAISAVGCSNPSGGPAKSVFGKHVSRSAAVSGYWAEIRQEIDGTHTVEACSAERPNCYDLDAEISNGVIEQVHFPNGGYLLVSAELEPDGTASDTDQDGTSWDFTLDLHAAIVEDAVQQWADAEGYHLD